MIRFGALWMGCCILVQGFQASAELQEIRVGGQIAILGEYYTHVDPRGNDGRYPNSSLFGRPTGAVPGEGILGAFAFDDRGGDAALVSQWTRLSVDADFSDGVGVTLEFDQVSEWGSSFRSDFVTGLDRAGADALSLYQAYIEASDLLGYPLRLRLGRQEIRLGSEWLVGGNDGGPAPAWGLSFDGARLTYENQSFSLDVWATKLFEDGGVESDGDVDFYGAYGSYTGIADLSLDAYWMYVRDARSIQDTQSGFILAGLENLWGVDDYKGTRVHTIGLRASGARGAVDFEGEIAYQFGDAGHAGSLFRPVFYGDDQAEYDNVAINIELGYTLAMAWEPRVFFAFAWLEGEDRRDVSWASWLESFVNPFYSRDASVSFNRLFSNWSYSAVLDGTDLSNAYVYRLGINLLPAEKVELALDLGYYLADETFGRPAIPLFSFWTRDTDAALGFESNVSATYHYSDELYFNLGWDRLFVGDGLRHGHFTSANGLEFGGGSAGDDVDYFYFVTGLYF